MAQKFLGFAVAYSVSYQVGNKISQAHKTPALAKANWLKDVVGIQVSSSWTTKKVEENFDFYKAMQGARVIKVFIEELEGEA